MAREPSELVKLLKAMNRKERYWLMRDALGVSSEGLSDSFRKKISAEIGKDIPCDAYWGLDYHLDWIAVALRLLECGHSEISNDGSYRDITVTNDFNGADNTKSELLRGSQQDADLLIAFENTIVIVEAKADGSWDREQMYGKVQRLREISALAQGCQPEVKIVLVLSSPKPTNVHKPTGKYEDKWPDWALRQMTGETKGSSPNHVHLPYGEEGGFLVQPQRYDRDESSEKARYKRVKFIRKKYSKDWDRSG